MKRLTADWKLTYKHSLHTHTDALSYIRIYSVVLSFFHTVWCVSVTVIVCVVWNSSRSTHSPHDYELLCACVWVLFWPFLVSCFIQQLNVWSCALRMHAYDDWLKYSLNMYCFIDIECLIWNITKCPYNFICARVHRTVACWIWRQLASQ